MKYKIQGRNYYRGALYYEVEVLTTGKPTKAEIAEVSESLINIKGLEKDMTMAIVVEALD